MEIPDFLHRLPDGEVVLTGHRIGLYHLVRGYNEGESAEMLASRYPTLSLALVHKVIAFYLDHRAEVDEYVASCGAAMRSQQDESRPLNLSALRLRLSVGSQSLPPAEHSL
jgi:uncharacterized protein (DUF433 family)